MTEHIKKPARDIEGRGGGGGKKGGSAGSDAENTLRSNSKARMVELLSEGPIEGLVNGAQSIYFDRTPLENSDGSTNFEGVIWEERKGLPDDEHLQGHGAVEQINPVGVEVTQAVGRVTREITDPEVDAVRMVIQLNSLFKVDSNGNLQRFSVGYAIDVQSYGGAWQTLHTQNIQSQKTTSPYQLAHKIKLPVGGAPWKISVRRTTPDDANDREASDFSWQSYVALKEGKFTYPHSALVGIEVDAESLGQNAPPRTYHLKGRIIDVPSNYDPETRTYSGIWDGTFKSAYSNNPAWIFNDAVTHDRYGLGEFVDQSMMNKWTLYQIGQYCDEAVPSGFTDGAGDMVYEPRFTFNAQIRDRREAYYALQTISRAFRGMGFWSLGQVFASADMPADPVKLVTPANVIEGRFNYSNTAMKARHTVAIVRFNDPVNHFTPTTELVIHEEGLKRFGWREKRLDFEGCSSRGLARRYGKWVLDTEQNEIETVEYKAGFDHIDVKPGDIVTILDPRKTSIRRGGRIKGHDTSTNKVTLDAPVTLDAQVTYTLKLVNDAGEIVDFPVSETGEVSEIDIGATAHSFSPAAVFIMTGSDLKPRPFRVVSMDETEENIFQITALEHDPTKYARVEQNISFDPPPYYAHPAIKAPKNLTADEIAYISSERVRTKIRLSWERPEGIAVREYVIRVNSETEFNANVAATPATNFDLEGYEPGDYVFGVQAIDRRGHISKVAEVSITVLGASALSNGEVQDLELEENPGGSNFTGKDVKIAWKNIFPQTSEDAQQTQEGSPTYSHNLVEVYDDDTNTLLRSARVSGERYVYSFEENEADSIDKLFAGARRSLRFSVSVHTMSGGASSPVTLSVSNAPPTAVSPVVTVNTNQIGISAPQEVDNDFAGMKVWIEEVSGFDESLKTPKYNGPSNYTSWSGAYGRTYHVKAGYRDLFDDTYTITPEVTVITEASAIGAEPAVPANLVVTSELAGNGLARLIADWDDNSESWVTGYELTFTQGSNVTTAVVNVSHYETLVERGADIDVTVKAIGPFGGKSDETSAVSITTATDTGAPATPGTITVTSGFETLWLQWPKNTEEDLSHYELSVNYSPNTGQNYIDPSLIQPDFIAQGESFAITGIYDGSSRYIMLRAVDTSGNVSPWTSEIQATPTSLPDTVGQEQIIAYTANIKDAVITDAKIANLSAAKLAAGTAIANSITVDGTALGTVNSRAANPAARINTGTTQIDPGKIVISGSTSLADWRGSDTTTIDGGKIETNSIRADQIIVGDFTNFADGSDFETPAANPWIFNDINTGIGSTESRSGSWSMQIGPTATLAKRAELAKKIRLIEGAEIVLRAWIHPDASFDGTSASEFRFYDQMSNLLASFPFDSMATGEWTGFVRNVSVPTDTQEISVEIWTDNAAGNVYIDDIEIFRKVSGDMIVNGSVTVNSLAAGVLSADNIVAGTMSVARLAVDDILEISAANSGFSMSKTSAYDVTVDGVYMGRTLEEDGSVGFGLSMSKTTDSGAVQSLQATEGTGLRIQNASFVRELSTPSSPTMYTSTQTISLAAATKSISLDMIGAGGGGAGGSTSTPGGDGQDTTVVLKDGTTVIKTWVVEGGAGATGTAIYGGGQAGESSPWGVGGPGGDYAKYYVSDGGGESGSPTYVSEPATPGGNGSGYGSGGGGGGHATQNNPYGGRGGKSGSFVSVMDYDVSTLTDPKLEITIGTGGQGVIGGNANGGNGAPGRVDVTEIETVPVVSDVIPIEPTFIGQFNSDFMGASTNQKIPADHGAGFYVIWTNDLYTGSMELGFLDVDDISGSVNIGAFDRTIAFVSNKTPVVTNSQRGYDRTLHYKFYKMGA